MYVCIFIGCRLCGYQYWAQESVLRLFSLLARSHYSDTGRKLDFIKSNNALLLEILKYVDGLCHEITIHYVNLIVDMEHGVWFS